MPTGAHADGLTRAQNGQISGFLCLCVELYGLRGETPKYGTFYKNNQQGRRPQRSAGNTSTENANRRRPGVY